MLYAEIKLPTQAEIQARRERLRLTVRRVPICAFTRADLYPPPPQVNATPSETPAEPEQSAATELPDQPAPVVPESVAAAIAAPPIQKRVMTSVRPNICTTAEERAARRIKINQILKFIAEAHNVATESLRNAGRAQNIVHARQHAMYVVRNGFPEMSLGEIGNLFRRDHSTVAHGVTAHRKRIEKQERQS